MNNNNGKIEKIFEKAILLWEKGESIEAIIKHFGEDYKNELREFLLVINALVKEREKTAPPKELLTRILSQIEKTEKIIEARPQPQITLGSLIFGFINRWKIAFGALAIAVVLAFFLASRFIGEKPEFISLKEFAIDEKEIALFEEELNQYTSEEEAVFAEIDKALEEIEMQI